MSNTSISFYNGPKGFFADISEGFGRKSIEIRYILDRSQKVHPIEGCYYEIETIREIPHPTRSRFVTRFVKLTNRERNEAQHQANMESAEIARKRDLQLRDELAQIKKEITSQWIAKYDAIPNEVRQFFFIGKPHNMADDSYSHTIPQMILDFHKWNEDFKKVVDWESEFPNIVKFMEEKSENANRNYRESSNQLAALTKRIAEIYEVITNYPKKRIFIKSVDAEVDVFYDQDEKRLAFMKEVYGKYTHYYAESDDGYRPAGSREVNGLHSREFFVNNDEAESIIPIFKDLIDLIETKKELNDQLNLEHRDWGLKRKAEGYAIAERLLPQELLTQAVIHIY